MPKRKLAIALFSTMSAVVMVLLATALALVLDHRSPVVLFAAATATMPGFVLAVLAWRGKLPDCAVRPKAGPL